MRHLWLALIGINIILGIAEENYVFGIMAFLWAVVLWASYHADKHY